MACCGFMVIICGVMVVVVSGVRVFVCARVVICYGCGVMVAFLLL